MLSSDDQENSVTRISERIGGQSRAITGKPACPLGAGIELVEFVSGQPVHGYSRRDAGYRIHRPSADTVSADSYEIQHQRAPDGAGGLEARASRDYYFV